ncbi:phage portal protein [Weissella confusa]|uniref:phage portal protein n=1 Tax=Weissella confusa TaxID=1583 RepID=UPI001C6F6BF5|nr:phage portal protein [Weissella confusa]QYU58202.1 phage portal protein [Weissella confusa]
MAEQISFLKSNRFNPNSNDRFYMSVEDFEGLTFESPQFIGRLRRYITNHRTNQLGRLKELKRYYLADNNIHYKPDKQDPDAADNRIASDFAKYITLFEQGYMLGKPVEYQNGDDTLQESIKNFSKESNEEYHNVLIKTDLSIYGRAYELLYVEKNGDKAAVRLVRLSPEQTFVVYDDTVNANSLFAVRYYKIEYEDNKWREFAEVYTSDHIYRYIDDPNKAGGGLNFQSAEEHHFKGVPVNEYSNNEDRTSAYEAVLDTIDAYDLSQSELANFQEDTNNALLVIKGNPFTGDTEPYITDDEGKQIDNPNYFANVAKEMKKARLMIMDDNPNPGGADPDAFYLNKSYDSAGAEAYNNRLVSDILRFTFTPDVTDNNFSGVQSGEAMKYKLMAADNKRVTQERLFAKSLMRRLRLAINIWRVQGNDAVNYDAINDTNIKFTPNIPQNNNELIENVKSIYGIVSDETILTILAAFTGVDPEDELKRLKEEKQGEDKQLFSRLPADDEIVDEEVADEE